MSRQQGLSPAEAAHRLGPEAQPAAHPASAPRRRRNGPLRADPREPAAGPRPQPAQPARPRHLSNMSTVSGQWKASHAEGRLGLQARGGDGGPPPRDCFRAPIQRLGYPPCDGARGVPPPQEATWASRALGPQDVTLLGGMGFTEGTVSPEVPRLGPWNPAGLRVLM